MSDEDADSKKGGEENLETGVRKQAASEGESRIVPPTDDELFLREIESASLGTPERVLLWIEKGIAMYEKQMKEDGALSTHALEFAKALFVERSIFKEVYYRGISMGELLSGVQEEVEESRERMSAGESGATLRFRVALSLEKRVQEEIDNAVRSKREGE